MRKDGVIGDVPLKLTPMRKEDQLVKYGDENDHHGQRIEG
jgi:hypothetical protein